MSTRPVPLGEKEARIGAAFRAAREAKGVFLADLAAALSCSINSIRWHEAGARMMRTDDLIRAAEVLGLPTSDLLPPEAAQRADEPQTAD